MKSIKKSVGTAVIAALLILIASPLVAEEAPDFLKGNVHLLDKAKLSLAKKFAAAEKEFKKSKRGDTYFTGYVFLSRHNINMGGDRYRTGPYSVTVKDNDIKMRRISKQEKSGESFRTEEGGEPVGLLFLHKVSRNKGEIIDVRMIDLDRTFEFKEEPVYWLGEADNDKSLQFLEDRFKSEGTDLQKTMVFIISSHDSSKGPGIIRRVALGDYATKVRKSAIFWLGNYKDKKSFGYLKEISNKVKDTELQKQVVFAIQLSDQEEALKELVQIAKTSRTQKVRKSAIFWLGQKASKECIKALKDMVEEEDDVDVKKSAVFAISQLPKEKAVPILIDIARTNKSPSVRKNAIFWLGQKDSTEALKFFEEILLKKK